MLWRILHSMARWAFCQRCKDRTDQESTEMGLWLCKCCGKTLDRRGMVVNDSGK